MDNDREFAKFLEGSDPGMFLIIISIREKLKYVCEMYKTTIENLNSIIDSETKNKIDTLLDDIISDYRICINQLDIVISEELDEDEDPDNESDPDFGGDI